MRKTFIGHCVGDASGLSFRSYLIIVAPGQGEGDGGGFAETYGDAVPKADAGLAREKLLVVAGLALVVDRIGEESGKHSTGHLCWRDDWATSSSRHSRWAYGFCRILRHCQRFISQPWTVFSFVTR